MNLEGVWDYLDHTNTRKYVIEKKQACEIWTPIVSFNNVNMLVDSCFIDLCTRLL